MSYDYSYFCFAGKIKLSCHASIFYEEFLFERLLYPVVPEAKGKSQRGRKVRIPDQHTRRINFFLLHIGLD